jgi:TPR repeat protein
MRFFLRSALKGYTPAMANVGTLYKIGATGRPNQLRAYAWVRTALSFGMPEEDHDATVLKLGMIVERLGSDNIGAPERLAGAIATRVVEKLPVLARPRNRIGVYQFLMSHVWHLR